MPFRLIWTIAVNDPDQRQTFVKNWHDASVVLQEYPGARGTRLHQVIGQPTYLAIAEWESAEARAAMVADTKLGTSERAQRWLAFTKNNQFGAVNIIAEAEEIAVVMPAGKIDDWET